MALIKFFKQNNKWTIGDFDGYPSGTCIRKIDPLTGWITVRSTNSPNSNGPNASEGIVEQGFAYRFCDASGVAYADLTALKTATDDFFVDALAGGGEKLDFLLVDVWQEDSGNYGNNDAHVGMILVNSYSDYVTTPVQVFKTLIINDDPTCIAGIDSDPYVPISQTTIFVHPTTFERYRFNGTEMVIFDDVDGVVPTFLKYEALLTQLGTNAPVARVLNANEKDYLGGLNAILDPDAGATTFNEVFDLSLSSVLCSSLDSTESQVQMGFNGEGKIYCNSSPIMGEYISIKQRLRGATPKLISAETNTAGDKVTLTFDKKVSDYLSGYIMKPDGTSLFEDMFLGTSSQFPDINQDFGQLTGFSNDGKSLTFGSDGNQEFFNGAVYTVGYNPSINNNYIESLDLGLLQQFTNFPVTNNVQA